MDRMLIAFGAHTLAVLEVKGRALEAYREGDPSGFDHDLATNGVQLHDPDDGLYVWEGEPQFIRSRDPESGLEEYDGVEFDRGKIRPLIEREWDFLRAGLELWPSQLQTCNEAMDFGEALARVKAGKSVARCGWGASRFLMLGEGGSTLRVIKSGADSFHRLDESDLLASDWYEVE